MGIEAASRGADSVIFNDISAEACALIRKNCINAGFTPTIYTSDYMALLKRFTAENRSLILFHRPALQRRNGRKRG
jgi:16S rRNA G966 N2-methylase RsmD